MTLDREEATRLLRQCHDDTNNSTKKDVTVESLCRLWAGMGYIYLVSSGTFEIVVKRITPPKQQNISFGDRRKAQSYIVEANFYQKLAQELINNHGLAIPKPHLVERGSDDDDAITICMSRLEGKPATFLGRNETCAALTWLATLHAATWGTDRANDLVKRIGLQPIGSFWHLDTRPDEHADMPRGGWKGRLKHAARAIDSRLKRDDMQCCIHGDAKDANMLFSAANKKSTTSVVAMCDFQYCGKAPPTVDLAYFFTVGTDHGDEQHDDMLQYYHEQLLERLGDDEQHKPTFQELQESLSLAYCDLVRFMVGWGFWGHDKSSHVIDVLDRLDGGRDFGSEEAYDEAVRREYG